MQSTKKEKNCQDIYHLLLKRNRFEIKTKQGIYSLKFRQDKCL